VTCPCEYCAQNRVHIARLRAERSHSDVLLLGMMVCLGLLALVGALAAWWIE